jgi:hypothetical protein
MALDTRYSRPGPDGGEALDTVVVADGSHAFDSMRAPDATQEDASVVMDAERSDGANAESDVVSTLVLLARGEGRFWKPGRMIQHDRLFDVGAAAAPRP